VHKRSPQLSKADKTWSSSSQQRWCALNRSTHVHGRVHRLDQVLFEADEDDYDTRETRYALTMSPKAVSIAQEEWQLVKDHFIDLHITQKRPLREVVVLMERELGFKAT